MMFYGANPVTLNMCLVADRLLPFVERKPDLLLRHATPWLPSNLRLPEAGTAMCP